MGHFYDIDSANRRLAELRPLLEDLRDAREALLSTRRAIRDLRRVDGDEAHERAIADREAGMRATIHRMEEAVIRLQEWDVTLRDIQSGLVDFPALASGRQIWLCWRLGEDAVAWWHEYGTGFTSRRPLLELS